MENKKTLILSIIGVLVLIVAVVGVSFAMYTFSATGTRENVIKTGTVSISYNDPGTCSIPTYDTKEECESNGGTWTPSGMITLSGDYPKTDEEALSENPEYATSTGNVNPVTFTLTADYDTTMTVNYALQFVELTNDSDRTTGKLGPEFVKLQIAKSVDGGGNTYPAGTASTGLLMSTFASNTNTLTGDAGYVFDSGVITGTTKITYTVKAWVSEEYDLYVKDSNVTATCSNTTYTTAAECQSHGATWTQTKSTTPETFTFKIRVVAQQDVAA